MRRLKAISLAVILVSCTVFAYAAFRIPHPQNYLNDYAGLLTSSQETELNAFLNSYDKKTTNQIFVGIFNSLDGENLEDLSIRIADQWQAGTKQKDNGVLLLVFLNERKIRIEVGYGLEPVLTDALAKAVIDNEITPNFRRQNYYQGIKSAVYKITKIISGEFSPEQLQVYSRSGRKSGGGLSAFLYLIIIIIIFMRFPLLGLLLYSGGYGSRGRYGGYYSGGGGFFGGGFGGGGGGGFGGGGASGGG